MMTMTSLQRAVVLGEIAQGATAHGACDTAGVCYGDLLAELDENEPFQFAYLSVTRVRDALSRELSRALEDGTK